MCVCVCVCERERERECVCVYFKSLALSPTHSQGFSAPSYDDKLVEVVGITGITQVTTAKVLGIQNQRIAQCRYAKITIRGSDTLPMQVSE